MATVTVRGSTPPGLVALWDTTQPAGEVYLVSGDVAEVELTLAVSSALARGALVLVGSTGSPTAEPVEPTTKPAPERVEGAEAPAPKRGRK